jgi:hypothetical protein
LIPRRSFLRVDVAASWRKAQADYAALKAERDALKAEHAEAHATVRGVAAIIRAAKTTTANQRCSVRDIFPPFIDSRRRDTFRRSIYRRTATASRVQFLQNRRSLDVRDNPRSSACTE